jgi:hypothetical protein
MNIPNEILNLIFSFRENHPTAIIMKPIINDYKINCYEEPDEEPDGVYYNNFINWTLEVLIDEKIKKYPRKIRGKKYIEWVNRSINFKIKYEGKYYLEEFLV